MHEFTDILHRIESLDPEEIQASLTTVISTSGSTYRRPSARMLVTAEDVVGSVSAGCLEDEIVYQAQTIIARQEPALLSFETHEEEDKLIGTGLGCRGTMEVFLEPVAVGRANLAAYRHVNKALRDGNTVKFALIVESQNATVPTGEPILIVESKSENSEDTYMNSEWKPYVDSILNDKNTGVERFQLSTGTIRLYAERVDPPPKLIVFGAGFDAVPLTKLAGELGFRITVVDPRQEYLAEARFPTAERLLLDHPQAIDTTTMVDERTYVIVMNHDYMRDLEALRQVLSSSAPYVGQIGPRERSQELLEDLAKERALPDDAEAKLYAPVGLDLGAETPQEIAVSIISELMAVKRDRHGEFLCQKQNIHKI